MEFISHRLRPEITYYVKEFTDPIERDRAVSECAWRLPRPAIFYTTEVDDAKALAERLRSQGFARIGCFHGETSQIERRRLIEAWRGDLIDIMVATSAFGLGVDKADVRAVVHACLPEDLHRYYQEVGRGGRDGCCALALLIHTPYDEAIARQLSATQVIGVELGLQRWKAMVQDAQQRPDGRLLVSLDARRGDH